MKLWNINIFSRYGILGIFISDKGPLFSGNNLKWLYEELYIEHRFKSSYNLIKSS